MNAQDVINYHARCAQSQRAAEMAAIERGWIQAQKSAMLEDYRWLNPPPVVDKTPPNKLLLLTEV